MNCYLFRFESKYETIIRVNHRTVKRKLLIIRLVIESMYRSSSCTSVINSNDGSRCKNFICKTRVRLRTHACWSCLVHSWYGHVVETINADTGMQVYICTAKGKEILLITQASGFHIRWEALEDRYPISPPCHFDRTLPKTDIATILPSTRCVRSNLLLDDNFN